MLSKIKLADKINKIEYYFFYAFLIINLLPVLVFKFFPTVDGPAHLYNSRLIIELFWQTGPLDTYFSFNEITPNWLGHILLSFFQLIFPAYIAEKCLLLIYFIGFPISFRAFIKSQPYHNNALIYFVFPFTYSFLLFYGFYNFHIGLVLFFWALQIWMKYINSFTIKRIFFLMLLTTLMCLSHLVVFGVFVLTVAIINLRELKGLFKQYKVSRKQLFNNLIHQFLALSIGLLITIKFIFTNVINNTIPSFIKSSVLLKWLTQIQPAKGIEYGKEDIFTRWIFIIIILLISYLVYSKIKRFILTQNKGGFSSIFKLKIHLWLIMSITFLIALFIVPDNIGAMGFMSSRMLLFFFLFLIAWLSTKKFHAWLTILVFIIINYVNIALLNIYYKSAKNNNIITNDISNASLKIEPFKTVLPINTNDYWLYGHISNYLGIDKPIVILENYEASLDYFPLKWNRHDIPNLNFGTMSPSNECLSWVSNSKNEISLIDYVFILSDGQKIISDECENKIINILAKDYIEVYKSNDDRIMLYRLKPKN